MQRQSPTAARAFNVIDLENDISEVLQPIVERSHRDYAPPAIREPNIPPMPAYVEHQDGVNPVGRLSAEAVVREFEAAAKEIEAMGVEMQEAAKKCEAMTATVHTMIEEIKATAQLYRDEGKKIFEQIEACSLMTSEVRMTCDSLKAKIAGPAS